MSANPYRDFVAARKPATSPDTAPKRDLTPPQRPVVHGTAWYHEEAIREARQAVSRHK